MPVSPYAASKLAAESATLAYGHSFGLPVLAFRFFNVFGPLQDARPCLRRGGPHLRGRRPAAGDPLPVHGDGRQTRDFTYVGSVASVLAEAVAGKVTAPRPVNLAFGTRVSLLELIDVLGKVLGQGPRARPHRAPERRRARLPGRPDPAPGDVPRRRAGRPRRRAAGHGGMVSSGPLIPEHPVADEERSTTTVPAPAAPGTTEAVAGARPGRPVARRRHRLSGCTRGPTASTVGDSRPSPNRPTRPSCTGSPTSGCRWCWWPAHAPAPPSSWSAATAGGRWPAWPALSWPRCWSSTVQTAGGPALPGRAQLPLGQRGRPGRGGHGPGRRRAPLDPAGGHRRRCRRRVPDDGGRRSGSAGTTPPTPWPARSSGSASSCWWTEPSISWSDEPRITPELTRSTC